MSSSTLKPSSNGIRRLPVEMTIEIVTPADASNYLATNFDNRPMRCKWIAELVAIIQRGHWRLSPDAIAFDTRGTLINGQHRLHAVLAAGVDCEFIVARGFHPDTFLVTDAGAKRSAADALAVARVTGANHKTTAATASLIVRYRSGKPMSNAESVRPTTTEIMETVKNNPAIHESVIVGVKISRLVAPSIAAFCHLVFAEIDADSADEFFSLLESGEGLTKGHPVYTLRERLIANRAGIAKLRDLHTVAYIFRAWNAFRAGNELKALRWNVSDAFPVPM